MRRGSKQTKIIGRLLQKQKDKQAYKQPPVSRARTADSELAALVVWSVRHIRFEIIHNDYPDKKLSEMFDVSITTIERWRRKLGVKKTNTTHKRSSKIWGVKDEFIKYHGNVSDKDIAKKYGISVSTVEKWRVKLGVKKGAGRWVEYCKHPKGFKGKTHTAKTRKKLSEISKKSWRNPNSILNSDKHRQLMSDRMSKLQASGKLRNGYSRCKSGYREDLGIFVRSAWEANYARYLNWLIGKGEIYKWEYEAETFWFHNIKRGVRSYKPDYKIWERKESVPYFVEVKGWMDAKSKTKIKRMAKYYPEIRLDVFASKEYKKLSEWAKLIPGWE